jgi:hypothetical protein
VKYKYVLLHPMAKYTSVFTNVTGLISGPGSSVGIATGYGLDGPGIESQ